MSFTSLFANLTFGQYTVYVSGSDYVTTNYSGNDVRFVINYFRYHHYRHYVQFLQIILIISLCSLVVRDDKSRQGSMLDIVVRKNSRMKANEAQLITVFNFF